MYCSYIIHVLFMRLTTTLFRKKILKMKLTILFTHLKIILLQCSILRHFMDVNKMSGCNLLLQQVKRV